MKNKKKLEKICHPTTRDGDEGEECTYWPRELYSYYLAYKIDPSR